MNQSNTKIRDLVMDIESKIIINKVVKDNIFITIAQNDYLIRKPKGKEWKNFTFEQTIIFCRREKSNANSDKLILIESRQTKLKRLRKSLKELIIEFNEDCDEFIDELIEKYCKGD